MRATPAGAGLRCARGAGRRSARARHESSRASHRPCGDRAECRVVVAPCVSVIVPTYNRAGLLPRALQSVLAQSCADFELIVVDDGSTDATPRVRSDITDTRV